MGEKIPKQKQDLGRKFWKDLAGGYSESFVLNEAIWYEATHTMQSDAVVQVKLSDNRKRKKSCFCCCINELQIEELRIVRK